MYLEKIIESKKASPSFQAGREKNWEVLLQKASLQTPKSFTDSLAKFKDKPSIIAEFKRASPSKGSFEFGSTIAEQVTAYQKGGARAISVLTEPIFFKSEPNDLAQAKEYSNLPILRKDFLLEPWEVAQARLMGADAILLIVAVLEQKELISMLNKAAELKLEVLLEVHSLEELERVLNLPIAPQAVGINNRNLKTFELNLETTAALAPKLPKEICRVSESGFATRLDLLKFNGIVDAFLIGETLMKSENPEQVLSNWIRG